MTGRIKHAVYVYLDSIMGNRVIGGWQIRDEIAEQLNYQVYPNVVLKICKHYAFITGGTFECIDRKRSIYKFQPGKSKAIGSRYEHDPVRSDVKYYAEVRKALQKRER